jgi:hypothetical protein
MARLCDAVTYAYCMGCGKLLIVARQAQYGPEVWHAWCALACSMTAYRGQRDRRN